MRTRNRTWIWVFTISLAGAAIVLYGAAGAETGRDASSTPKPVSIEKPAVPPGAPALPLYVPPKGLGAPGGRKGGAARGNTTDPVVLSVVAPDHTALSARDQPTLYWYISKPTATPIEFTLLDERSVYPRLEVRVGKPNEAGLQRVRLADYNIRLEPGVMYEWTVAVVVDPVRRSKDLLAGGVVMYRELPSDVADRLAREERTAAPGIYAWSGFWYDAVSSMSELIDASPQDPWLRRQRAALLEQADLPEVAAYDKVGAVQ